MIAFAENLFNLEPALSLRWYKDRWRDDQKGEIALGGPWASDCPILCFGKTWFCLGVWVFWGHESESGHPVSWGENVSLLPSLSWGAAYSAWETWRPWLLIFLLSIVCVVLGCEIKVSSVENVISSIYFRVAVSLWSCEVIGMMRWFILTFFPTQDSTLLILKVKRNTSKTNLEMFSSYKYSYSSLWLISFYCTANISVVHSVFQYKQLFYCG